MFANFLIGLREGLEAALIVAILVAYVVKVDQRQLLPRLWMGVGLAVALSLGAGALLTFTTASLSDSAAEVFAGVTSLAAVGLITWMIFWMARNARAIKGHLHGEVDRALAKSGWALALVAFFAVIREGLETALFLWAGMQSSGERVAPTVGALLGLALAVGLGVLMYLGSVRLDLGRLFYWTGLALVVIAAGVLRYAIHEFQEVGILPGMDEYALDLTSTVDPAGVPATLVRGMLNVTPAMTALEIIGWVAYVAVVMSLFVRTVRRSRPTPTQPQPAVAATTAT